MEVSFPAFPESFQLQWRVELYWRVAYIPVGISTSNIAWGSTLPRYASREKLDETLGSLQAVSLERHDGMPLGKGLPRQILQSAKWPTYFDSGIRGHFYLIGFGKSFLRGEEPDKLKQPFRLRCPETIMGEKLDYRLDLWHTGCLVSVHKCRAPNDFY